MAPGLKKMTKLHGGHLKELSCIIQINNHDCNYYRGMVDRYRDYSTVPVHKCGGAVIDDVLEWKVMC